eukprot:4798771-Pyramimonas_sp.AAC.1
MPEVRSAVSHILSAANAWHALCLPRRHLLTAPRPNFQQVSEACPTLEHVERGDAFRRPRRDIISVKWLVPVAVVSHSELLRWSFSFGSC